MVQQRHQSPKPDAPQSKCDVWLPELHPQLFQSTGFPWTSHWASTNLTHVLSSPTQVPLSVIFLHPCNTQLCSLNHSEIAVWSRYPTLCHLYDIRQSCSWLRGAQTKRGRWPTVQQSLFVTNSTYWQVLTWPSIDPVLKSIVLLHLLSPLESRPLPWNGLICDQGWCVSHTTSPQALTAPHLDLYMSCWVWSRFEIGSLCSSMMSESIQTSRMPHFHPNST